MIRAKKKDGTLALPKGVRGIVLESVMDSMADMVEKMAADRDKAKSWPRGKPGKKKT